MKNNLAKCGMTFGVNISMRRQYQIGTKVTCRFGEAKITAIELCEREGEKEGIPVKKIWADLKDRCVFVLDNGHWQYGCQVEAL